MYSVIIAGGGGLRLWPLSTPARPKPLLEIAPGKTLLDATLERAGRLSAPDRILMVLTEEIREPVLQALPASFPKENILIEPVGRNTAPCAALAAEAVRRRDPDAVMALFPADHCIRNADHFVACLRAAEKLAAETGDFVLLGLKPQEPSTEYGYILLDEEISRAPGEPPAYRSRGFSEKPDRQKALQLIEGGTALWNSGIYVARASRILDEIRRNLPAVHEAIARHFEDPAALARAYAGFPSISIDYAVTEKLPSFLVLSTDMQRLDVGHFNSFHELWEKDTQGNAFRGDFAQIGSSGNIVHGSSKPVALVGIRDTVVIDTPEALLVCARSELHRIKEIRERFMSLKKGEKNG